MEDQSNLSVYMQFFMITGTVVFNIVIFKLLHWFDSYVGWLVLMCRHYVSFFGETFWSSWPSSSSHWLYFPELSTFPWGMMTHWSHFLATTQLRPEVESTLIWGTWMEREGCFMKCTSQGWGHSLRLAACSTIMNPVAASGTHIYALENMLPFITRYVLKPMPIYIYTYPTKWYNT